jgi:hypothetical protein
VRGEGGEWRARVRSNGSPSAGAVGLEFPSKIILITYHNGSRSLPAHPHLRRFPHSQTIQPTAHTHCSIAGIALQGYAPSLYSPQLPAGMQTAAPVPPQPTPTPPIPTPTSRPPSSSAMAASWPSPPPSRRRRRRRRHLETLIDDRTCDLCACNQHSEEVILQESTQLDLCYTGVLLIFVWLRTFLC